MDKKYIGLSAIILCHLYTFRVFGATYWYDSAIYFQFAKALVQPDGLLDFYNGPRFYLFQHLMPAFPLLVAATYSLSFNYIWIAIAAFQHIIAAFVLFYFLTVVRRWLPLRAVILLGILIALHPFCAAFHNALLTESLSGSFLLFGLSLVLDATYKKTFTYRQLNSIAFGGILATQLRSYLGIIFIFYLGLFFFLDRSVRRRLTVVISTILVGLSLITFPIYRFTQIDDFFMPNVDNIILQHVLYVNSNSSAKSFEKLNKIPFPPDLPMEKVLTDGLDYTTSPHLAAHIDGITESNHKTRQMLSEAAYDLRFINSSIIFNQVRLNLSSIGFNHLHFCCDKGLQIRRGGYTWTKPILLPLAFRDP
jgi:hypothetical protein